MSQINYYQPLKYPDTIAFNQDGQPGWLGLFHDGSRVILTFEEFWTKEGHTYLLTDWYEMGCFKPPYKTHGVGATPWEAVRNFVDKHQEPYPVPSPSYTVNFKDFGIEVVVNHYLNMPLDELDIKSDKTITILGSKKSKDHFKAYISYPDTTITVSIKGSEC